MRTITEQIRAVKNICTVELHDTKEQPNLRLLKENDRECLRDACSTLIALQIIGVGMVVVAPELVAATRVFLKSYQSGSPCMLEIEKLQEIINRL